MSLMATRIPDELGWLSICPKVWALETKISLRCIGNGHTLNFADERILRCSSKDMGAGVDPYDVCHPPKE